MTSANFDESQNMTHTELANALKESAVDAWVVSESGYNWMINGGQYVQDVGTSAVTLSRPDGARGGGVYRIDGRNVPEMTEYYREAFASVRSTIDDLVGPWADIPDVGQLKRIRKHAKDSVNVYGTEVGADQSLGIYGTNPNLSEPLEKTGLALADMSGGAINAIEEKLLVKLTGAINAHCVVAQVREAAIEVERSMWESVTRKFPEILQAADSGMRKIAANGTASFSSGLGTLKQVLEFVGLVPGPAARGAQIAGKSFTLVEKATDTRFWTPAETGTYADLLADLATGLESLSKWVSRQESDLAKLTAKNISVMRGDRGAYDLSVTGISATGTEIVYHTEQIESMIIRYLPALAAELTMVAGTNSGCLLGNATKRASVGLTPLGAGPEIDELSYLLQALTIDLSGEVAEATLTLRTVLDDFISVEQEAMDTVARFLAELDQSRLLDPLSQPESPSEMIKVSPVIPDLAERMGAS